MVDLGSDECGQIPYALIKDTLRVELLSLSFLCLQVLYFTSWLTILVYVTLKINDDEVELWVVKAITAKLIDCKMDQMNQIVIVRCAVLKHLFVLLSYFALPSVFLHFR